MRRSQGFSTSVFAILLTGLALAACEPDANPTDPSGDRLASLAHNATFTVCPTRTARTASATIGADGGTVSVDGASLTIPAGALPGPTEIELTVPVSRHAQVDVTADGREDFAFRTPVTLVISYDRCPPGQVRDTLGVWEIDPGTGAPVEFLGGHDDKERRHVEARPEHLTSFVIASG